MSDERARREAQRAHQRLTSLTAMIQALEERIDSLERAMAAVKDAYY